MVTSETMRAAVLKGPGDLQMQNISIPEPDPDEVLVRVRACGICGSDIEIRDHGMWQEGSEYPFILGHEWTGEVVETGPETYEFEPGDRVANETHSGCGFCRNCKRGRYTACINYGNQEKGHKHYGFTVDGGYAQYCTIREPNLHHLPDTISFREGTLITTGACSLYGVERANVEAGDSVVILGPGPIGLTAIECARSAGAGEVVVTGTREYRLEIAEELGADRTVNVHEEDPLAVAKKLNRGEGPDVVLETAGVPETIRQAIEMPRSAGRVGLIGNPGNELLEVHVQVIINRDLDVFGVKAQGQNSAERYTRLMERRGLKLEPLLTHQYDFEDIHEAMRVFEEREDGALKVVLNM